MSRHRNLRSPEMAYSSSDSSTVSYYDSDSDSSDDEFHTQALATTQKPDNSSSKIEIDKALLEYLLERGQKTAPELFQFRSSASNSSSLGKVQGDSNDNGSHSEAAMKALSANKEMIKIGARKLMEVGFSQDQSKAAMRFFGNYQDALDGLLSNQVGSLSTESDDAQSTHSSEACSIPGSDKDQNVEPTDTVWIGNVLPQITNGELRDIFSNCGKIVSVRILRPGNYAFIQYSDISEASKAVKTLYGFSFKNCKLIVRFTHSKPKPKPEQAGSQNPNSFGHKFVCVSNIQPHIGNLEIKELFANAGAIKEISFERDKHRAFVEYNAPEEARAAVTRFNGFTFKSAMFAVRTVAFVPAKDKSSVDRTAKSNKRHKVIRICGVPTQIGNKEIKELFANAGTIKDIKYERPKQRVFIEYNTPEEAQAAVTRFNTFEFKGGVFAVQTVVCLPSNDHKQPTGTVETKETVETKQPQPPNLSKYDLKCIWAGNLHPEVKDLELINIFSKFGHIASYNFLRERMCAFITFKSEEAAQKAIDTLQGHEVRGQKIWTKYVLNVKENEKVTAKTTDSETKKKSNSSASSVVSSALRVVNVVPQITDQDLIQLFCRDAKIKSYKILRDGKCAFFNYHNEADATKTLRRLQGYNIKGSKLILNYTPEGRSNSGTKIPKKHSAPKESKTNLNNPNNYKSICVGNLTPDINEGHIIQLFSRCGPITSSKFMPEHKCVFLNYTTSQEATRVLRTFQNYSFRGTVLNLRFSKKGGVAPQKH